MMTTQFLYGIDPEELASLKYYDALKLKKEKGKELYRKLYVGDIKEEDHRMFYVLKAVQHTEKLLHERDRS